MNRSKRWLITYFSCVVVLMGIIAGVVAYVDPFMHYHKPFTDQFFYSLDNQRSQNDGIAKHFDYDAIVIGSSMTENFKTSEIDHIFGVNSIKIPYSGGSYKELNDSLKNALSSNAEINMIIRCLDMDRFFDDQSAMRTDLGSFPTYLYNQNLFDDVNYVFNRDVIYTRTLPMLKNKMVGGEPGITPFDEYSNWMGDFTFGKNSVLAPEMSSGYKFTSPTGQEILTNEEKETISGNITENVVRLAEENPDVEFYYFFPPYSAVWWGHKWQSGLLEKEIAAEKYIIELMLPHENIHLFSWNDRLEVTADLNNYKDMTHYGIWVNSWMLEQMKKGEGQITQENYVEYLKREEEYYKSFDYNALFEQEDYEADYYAAAVLSQWTKQVEPLHIDGAFLKQADFENAELIYMDSGKRDIIQCKGSIQREVGSGEDLGNYLYNSEFCGVRFSIDNAAPYKTLVFYGKRLKDHGQPSVYVYDSQGNVLANFCEDYHNLDDQWHMYAMALPGINENITVIFHGGYVDETGSPESSYMFSEITLY